MSTCYNIGHEIEIVTGVPAGPSDAHDCVEDIEERDVWVVTHDKGSEVEKNTEGKLQNELGESIEEAEFCALSEGCIKRIL